jgi:thioesterase domain-containing protein
MTDDPGLAPRVALPECLVTLDEGNAGSPLFLVHPVDGTVFAYFELAMLLASWGPVYGLEARGLHGHAPDRTLEEAARAYRDLIVTVQTSGPYTIGGWSLGGAIAFETARLLADGGEAAHVIAVDTDPDWLLAEPADDAGLVRGFERNLARQLGRSIPGEAPVSESLATDPESVADRLIAAGLLPKAARAQIIGRLPVYLAFARGFSRYRPVPASVRMTLLSTKDGAPAQVDAWRGLALGGYEIHEFDGDHYSLLRPPRLEELAKAIDRCA